MAKRNKSNSNLKIVFWGTYDAGKPRVRLLIAGARETSAKVFECHSEIWNGAEDKSQIAGIQWLRYLLRWLASYPGLILRYLRLPPHDVVVVPYMGQLDVIVLRPFAALRRTPIAWDMFLSLYDTVVRDRKILSAWSPPAWVLYVWEFIACRCANAIFMDTRTHARYVEDLFLLRADSVGRVFLGAETEVFSPKKSSSKPRGTGDPVEVLFYGQFIPLHGLDTIIEAARILQNRKVRVQWIVIGSGQEAARIDAKIKALGLNSIKRIPWVPYGEIPARIARADICLGIFGTGGKTQRVIPNKVFQILAMGKPLITEDTTAIRELGPMLEYMRLVPAGDAEALARVIGEIIANTADDVIGFPPDIGSSFVGTELSVILKRVGVG